VKSSHMTVAAHWVEKNTRTQEYLSVKPQRVNDRQPSTFKAGLERSTVVVGLLQLGFGRDTVGAPPMEETVGRMGLLAGGLIMLRSGCR
jgi:hypothetical protein